MSKAPEESGRGVLRTIREIKAGTLKPKLLSPEDRRACVGHVYSEGLSVPQTAEFLKVSERTITRDRKVLQEEGAIDRDPRLAGVVAGQLILEADSCRQHIRRTTRDKNAPHAVRVEGERVCFVILCDLTQRLQSLGYLPTAAQEFTATLSHTIDDIPQFEETKQELLSMSQALKRTGAEESEESRRVSEITSELDRAKLAFQTANVKQQIERNHDATDQNELPSRDPGQDHASAAGAHGG